MKKGLSPEQLVHRIDPKALGIKSTENIKPLNGIIGRKRAVSALRFGLQIEGVGYNIYVAGPPGIGKMTSVRRFLEEFADKKKTPPDWCYVNNFQDHYKPKAIRLPTGKGNEFKKDMNDLIDHIQRELPQAFESDEYTAQREAILNSLNKEREEISKEINQRAEEKGFKIQSSPMGVIVFPVKDGEPLNEKQFQKLSESEQKEIEKRREEFQKEMKGSMKKLRKIERKTQDKVKDLDQRIALNIVGGMIDDLKEKYEKYEKIVDYLKEVQKDILENIDSFKANKKQVQQDTPASLQNHPRMQLLEELSFRKYQVNVFVDNSEQEGAPVIVELNPNYNNLMGRIEKEMQFGALNTDFTLLRAGSLARANGGFLVLPVEEVLRNFYTWDALKRALSGCEIQLEELSERLGFVSIKTLRPQPIPLDVKVLLVGRSMWYYLLHAYDEDFPETFKVKADYDTQMSVSDDNVHDFIAFVSTYCEKEKLRHLDAEAAARLLEHAARRAEDQEKLSTEFGHLADLIREADFWAQDDKSSLINAKHVKKALAEKVYRSNLIEERIQEMIERGTLLIDTEEEAVGQVNGLSVLNLGNYEFGKPSRITATVGPGRSGVIDIEREVELGGPVHSKGVLILGGYLTRKYARERPLTLDCRLVFEQSYQGVEGDSASSAELYAILSALSGASIKQGIAVTGSVNQNGEVQAIGGVNEKIEGFFEVCKKKGLTGDQGVLIPQSNVKNLMLKEDVVEAVEEEKFNIWAVETIDEGIEILTGVSAGEMDDAGNFPENTLNERVRRSLRSFEKTLRELRNGLDGRTTKKQKTLQETHKTQPL